MITRRHFVNRWKKEFGCQCDATICWCTPSIKLGFLYDWLLEEIGKSIISSANKDPVEAGTVGEASLPYFMGYRRVK